MQATSDLYSNGSESSDSDYDDLLQSDDDYYNSDSLDPPHLDSSDSDYEPPNKIRATNVPPNAILNLNDDCLLHIFSYLSFCEKFRMSTSCERFENIYRMIFKKALNIKDILKLLRKTSMRCIKQFFIKYGDLIEHVYYDNNYSYLTNFKWWHHFFILLTHSCPNLKTFKFKHLEEIYSNTHLLSDCKSINELELICCNINNESVFYLTKLPNLTSLNLSSNEGFTGKYLNKLEKLQSLALWECTNIKLSYMVKFCKSLKLLRELALEVQNEETIDLIVRNMKNLEKLIVSVNVIENIHKIADIENLKSLTLKMRDKTVYDLTDLMKKLAIKNTLETLRVSWGRLSTETLRLIPTIKSIKKIIIEPRKNDNEILENFAKCKSLQYLCLEDFCDYDDTEENVDVIFFEKLILGVVDVINRENRSEPFKLIIGYENVKKIYLKDLVPSSLSKILKVSFKEPDYYSFIKNDKNKN